MVFYDPSPLGVEYAEVVERAAALAKPLSVSGSRLVVSSNTPVFRGESRVVLIKGLGNHGTGAYSNRHRSSRRFHCPD